MVCIVIRRNYEYASEKELEVCVRYWSTRRNAVMTQHLETFFMGRATADDLHKKTVGSLVSAGLPLNKLLMLGSDGPNVNKKVARLFNEDIVKLRTKPLVDLGTCNIHVMHNSFLRGVDQFGDEASDFVIGVYEFFDGWPGRWEDCQAIQKEKKIPDHRFIKHVKSRWLTLEGAAERCLEQMVAIEEFFLRYAPVKRPELASKRAFQKIQENLKNPTLKAELLFLISSAKVFTKFSGMFQRDEPLIHVMYDELKRVYETIALRICKKTAVEKLGLSEKVFESQNFLPISEINLGDDIKADFLKLKVSAKDQLLFASNVQSHYKSAGKEVFLKSALLNKPKLIAFRCLQPGQRLSTYSSAEICDVKRALPLQVSSETLIDEWRLMQMEDDVKARVPIVAYWTQIFDKKTVLGEQKYPTLSKLVKAALCLTHGNAFVERAFSSSALALTDGRSSMNELTLNNINSVKSGLKLYDNKPFLVPITKELLAKARFAHAEYLAHLDREKKAKEEERRIEEADKERQRMEEEALKKMDAERKSLQTDEQRLKDLRKEEKEKGSTADVTLKEANERLKKAMDAKDFQGVAVAQGMLEAAKARRMEANNVQREAAKLQCSIDKRKSQMLAEKSAKKTKFH